MNHIAIHEREFRGATFRFYETEHKASFDTFTDEQEVRDAWWHIEPGQVVIDVGAGMGSYTLPACALGAAQVIAFCPQQPDLDLLRLNVALNGFRQCEIRDTGLADQPGWVAVVDNAMLFSVKPRLDAFPVSSLDAHMLTLDRLDWLKIDVEGFEREVLWGAEQTIRQYRPTLLVEYHLFMDPSIELQCRHTLKTFGYTGVLRRYHAIAHGLYHPEP